LGSSTGTTTFTSANAGASNYTLTIPAASTTIPVATQTLTFSGPTTARTITLPDAAFTVASLTTADQTVTGGANITSASQSAGNITVDCGANPQQYIANTGAFTITAPTNDGNCIIDMENGVGAGALTLSGFSPNTMGGATLDTTNGHNFRIYVSRIHAHATIDAKALQ